MLKDKILDLLNRSDFMTLSTSVAGNSSAANVYFANDGLDIYFFTFNPSRKAVQISMNPKVQCVIRPDGEDGIKELQIDAYASKVTDKDEVERAIKKVNSKNLNSQIVDVTNFESISENLKKISEQFGYLNLFNSRILRASSCLS